MLHCRKALAPLALLLTFLAVSNALADTTPPVLKAGYVEMSRIISDSTPAQQAEKKLEKEFSKRQKDLVDQQAFLRALADKLAKDMPKLSPEQKQIRQKDLTDLTNEWNRKQKQFQDDLDSQRYEELRKVLVKANKATAEIAKARGFGLVVEDAIYVDPSINLTTDVIKMLNQDATKNNVSSSPSNSSSK